MLKFYHAVFICSKRPVKYVVTKCFSIAIYVKPKLVQFGGLSTTLYNYTEQPKFDPTRVRTHGIQIMTVHFMPMRRPFWYEFLPLTLNKP